MNITWRRLGVATLAWLALLALTACRTTQPVEETLEAFEVTAPAAVASGETFEMSVAAVGSQGTTPFTQFSGTVSLSVSPGTLDPTSAEVTNGTASVDATVTDVTGEVTITVSDGAATGTASLTVGAEGELLQLPGDAGDPASEAIPVMLFEARPDDYSDDSADLNGVFVSFNTLLLAFVEGINVGDANALLTEIGATIVGGLPGVEGEAEGILALRVPTSNHQEMSTLLVSLRDDPRVLYAVQDALLETSAIPRPNAGNPADWTWQLTPTGGNWGLELIRAPQTWNLNASVTKTGGATPTGVLDTGFADAHEDLTYEENQTPGTVTAHGTHVAGTIAADFDNGVGVDGVNPFAGLVVRARDASLIGGGTVLEVRSSFGEAHLFGFFDLVRSRPDLRTVNISLGYNWGPAGIDQDNDAAAQELVEQQGALFGLAQVLTLIFNPDFSSLDDLPMVVAAAGNDSNWGFGTQQARWSNPFAYAALEFGFDNILVVESVANLPGGTGGATRSNFSNVGGHVSAPGSNVRSTVPGDGYGLMSGTSMAAPHVTGLVGYLLAVDPSLTHAQVRSLLIDNAVPVAGGASDRIDAFAAVMDIDRINGNDAVLRRLLDIDDGTPDGNQRLLVGTTIDFTGEDADGDGGVGDGNIDMSDFRRFRDWLLQVENPPDLDLDGSASHPKKDVNGNSAVGSPNAENVFPRGDFNGDGQLSRTATNYVPGVVDATVTDLEVLQLLFDDPHYDAAELPGLLDSGDLEIWPRSCLDRSDVVRVESTILDGTTTVGTRTHTLASGPRQIYTASVNSAGGYTAEVRAYDAADTLVFSTSAFFGFAPGSDAFWDPTCNEAPDPPAGARGESWGDPHQITFDRLKYDFQAVGEFIFVESDSGDLVIQVRQEPWGSSRRVSVNTAVATNLDGQRVAFYQAEPDPMLFNGDPTPVPDGGSVGVGDGTVFRDGDLYTVVYPNGEQLRVRVRAGRMDLNVVLDPARSGSVAGLLGDADGDPANDIATRAGSVFAQPVAFGDLYGDYANSWRISSNESLFDYGPGEGTGAFTDTTFPDSYASTGDLTPAQYASAEAVCIASGISSASLLNSCILDVALTGDDSFAEDSAAAQSPRYELAVIPETYAVALLYSRGKTDATSSYVAGLEARGFDVEPVMLGSTESANAFMLQEYDLLLIDTFTGYLSSWDGDAKVVNAVQQSGRPVIGLGEGGYAFFGQVSSALGWPQGAHGSGLTSFGAVLPKHPSLTGPRSVGISRSQVAVTSPGMGYATIYVPKPAPPLELVGRTGANHYVALIDSSGVGSALWGFHGVPSGYTDDGWNALANLMSYLIDAP